MINLGNCISYVFPAYLGSKGWSFYFFYHAFDVHAFIFCWPDERGRMNKAGEFVESIDHPVHFILGFYPKMPWTVRGDAMYDVGVYLSFFQFFNDDATVVSGMLFPVRIMQEAG